MRGRGTGERDAAVKSFLSRTKETVQFISTFFARAFPAHHELFTAAFNAGVYDTRDPGPFLGRALVWKLHVDPHVDKGDNGPAVIFNFGNYTGGELYLPDLNLKLT